MRTVLQTLAGVSVMTGCLWLQSAVAQDTASSQPAMAAEAAAPGEVQRRMRQAYASTDTYAADLTFRTVISEGRRERVIWSTFHVAYDRTQPAIVVDRPGARLVGDGTHLYLRLDQLAQKHLKMPMPRPLDYRTLFDLLPSLHEPMLPDVVMLLSDNPFLPLAGWWSPDRVEEVSASQAEDGRPRLRLSTQSGVMTLILDPQTYLVVESTLEIDPAVAQLSPGQTVTQGFEINIRRHNQPLSSDAFAWAQGPGQAVSSVEALFDDAAPPAPVEPPHPLIGQETPPVVLETADGKAYQVSDIEAEVIVLDFWATWCMPCRMWMPQLGEIQNWADANGKSVQIVGVSVDQDEPAARRFWKQHDYPMMLALPQDIQAVSIAYGPVRHDVSGQVVPMPMPLPYTVVIHHNKVVDIHQGVSPQMRGKLQAQIEDLLAQ